MRPERLQEILSKFPTITLLVLGDFFLDQYLVTDPRLSEVSLETGLEARQVVEIRNSPGACGTVASNLAALKVGRIEALGIIGNDGHGLELMKGLQQRGIGTELMIRSPQRRTPTYTKPMRLLPDASQEELERFDIKNRTPTPPFLQECVWRSLERMVGGMDGVILGDQVQEEDCGVITARLREIVAKLAGEYPGKIFIADSRARIGRFRRVMIKPNEREAAEALDAKGLSCEEMAARLYEQAGRPVFLTRGAAGISIYDGREYRLCPAIPVSSPIDPVGAGDSVTAGIVSSLCAGASLWEAAQIGNLVASVTIRQIGTTGTASPEKVVDAFRTCTSYAPRRK